MSCAREKVKSCEDKFIGFLSIKDAEEYHQIMENYRTDGELLLTNGATILKGAANSPSCQFLKNSLVSSVTHGNIKLDCLAHNFDRDRNKGLKTHDHRTWQQLHPNVQGGEYCRPTKWSKENIQHLETMKIAVIQRVLPHFYYSRKAIHNTLELGTKFEATVATKDNLSGFIYAMQKNKNGSECPILSLHHANILAKGRELKEPQTSHIDGTGNSLLVIIVRHCGKDGYNFDFIPASHDIVKHDLTMKVPESMFRTVKMTTNDILVFSERVIHRGGVSSIVDDNEYADLISSETFPRLANGELCKDWMKSATNNDVKANQPTDLSLQFTFECVPLQSAASCGRASPLWYKNKGTENDVTRFREYIQRSEHSFSDWVNSNDCMEKWIETMKKNVKLSCRVYKKKRRNDRL